jgi:hypothetical protein
MAVVTTRARMFDTPTDTQLEIVASEQTARTFVAPSRPSGAETEQAMRTLIHWAGDDPVRESLLATPDRVVRAYEEWFAGYRQDPVQLLQRTFGEVGGYEDIVLLRDIPLESVYEHHMAATRGVVCTWKVMQYVSEKFTCRDCEKSLPSLDHFCPGICPGYRRCQISK